jgi:hypothetical protein
MAMTAPLDEKAARVAMRAAAKADEASQRVGVRPVLSWPARKGRRLRERRPPNKAATAP